MLSMQEIICTCTVCLSLVFKLTGTNIKSEIALEKSEYLRQVASSIILRVTGLEEEGCLHSKSRLVVNQTRFCCRSFPSVAGNNFVPVT